MIVPGRNYGWPEVEGIESGMRASFELPIAQWATSESSPSGIAVGADGAVYMAALRGESLWKINVDGASGEGTRFGCWRTGMAGCVTSSSAPDGTLCVLSNNTFRGEPRDGDDRIIRVPIG